MKKQETLNNIFKIFIILFIISFITFGTIFIIDYKKSNNTKETKEEVKPNLEYTSTNNIEYSSYMIDVSEIVENAMPSIVSITSKTLVKNNRYGFLYNSDRYVEGAGSGVIISEDENNIYILTNYHVVENSSELSIKFIDDTSCDGQVRGISKRKDIAIIYIEKSKLTKETLEKIKMAKLGSSDELKVGNGIIAIGNALGYGQSVTTGVVSALDRELSTDNYIQQMIQIDAAINGGNSGGALLNNKGEVVGINTAKYSNNSSSSASIEGMGFAIPISDIKNTIEKLIKGEDDTSSILLGIEGYITSYVSSDLPVGFYITKISDNSNASKSELEIGNIITEIYNVKVTDSTTIRKVLNNKDVGDIVTLKVSYISNNKFKE